ncbi:MAG: alpha/beta fold hydrolase [Pseudooceanicola atlanticus]
MRLLLTLAFLALSACSLLPPPQQASETPMLHDGNAEKGVDKVIMLIPGALASVGLFEPVLDWHVPDSAVMAYRFPGIDDLPLDHRVDIVDSGKLIAKQINDLAPKEVYLIGYSTGGPIALETARRLQADDVQIALISSASDSPAALLASARGAIDVVKAMFRAKQPGLDETWLENYRTLLYGRRHFTEEELAERSRQMAAMQRGHITKPPNKMTLAHTSDLMTWYLDRPEDVQDARIGFFHGAEDSIFSQGLTRRFASRIQAETFYSYPGQGHLLFVTSPSLFNDIRTFFGLQPDS